MQDALANANSNKSVKATLMHVP